MTDRNLLINSNTADASIHEYDDTCGTRDNSSSTWCSIPCRYVMALLLMTAFALSFTQRTVMNIALVAMVNFTEKAHDNDTSKDYCPANSAQNNSKPEAKLGEFNWNADLQALVLGAFYYGYPISQLPFGYLAERFGGKAIFAFNGLSSGILTLLIPTVARWSPYALIALRGVQGLCQGCMYPTCLAMWSRWGPQGERNMLYAITTSGAALGNIIAMAVSGALCQSTFLGGWPSTFYLFGGLSVLWIVVWLFLGYDTPAVHPRITQAELNYISRETQHLATTKYSTPPWCSIARSLPIWGSFIIQFTNNLGFYISSTSMPLYMKQVLHFDMSQDGLMSSLPYLIQYPILFGVGFLADLILQKGLLRLVNIRRGAAFIGQFLPGVFLLLVSFVGCNKMAAVAMLVLTYSANAFMVASGVLSLFDIAPLYAGSIMGILNGISNTNGFIAPLISASITNNTGDQMAWRTVFYIGASTYIIGTVVYCVLITDEQQPWAKGQRTTEGHTKDVQVTLSEDPPLT